MRYTTHALIFCGSAVAVLLAPLVSPAMMPPTLLQALLSLYLDGAAEESDGLVNVAEFYSPNGFSLDPHGTKVVLLAELLQFFRPFGSYSTHALRAGINFNLPYAGPFGLFAWAAGAEAVYQAVQW